jgi:hypothetical protein
VVEPSLAFSNSATLDSETTERPQSFWETKLFAGSNVVVIDPEALDVFPNSATVNRTLRALAPALRRQHRPASKRRSA